eukprot:CAMPEP_0201507424 /NCGR_PEP_ID=MMETSP0161_2-20130828/1094_1 /ASSEMBLY_ACC=CAM_ASM_000251 /TAXON_ID=180227 /ORGANISM="Neoparamoeba aestuarina, Strain SoJaBio B1-5/56/2" /LENGTH=108 /DNA_ID=CAMNT_0047901785 /DNA_START=26 /DNA_END=352 /DNA_ORIENTATION=+
MATRLSYISGTFRRLAPANEARARIFGNRLGGADGTKSIWGKVRHDKRVTQGYMSQFQYHNDWERLRKLCYPLLKHESEINAYYRLENWREKDNMPTRKGEGKRQKRK